MTSNALEQQKNSALPRSRRMARFASLLRSGLFASATTYIRSWRGRNSVWFRQAQRRHEGRISAGGVTKDVTLVDASSDKALNDEIDAAYQSKYRRHSAAYVDPMIAPQARATTLKLVPSV